MADAVRSEGGRLNELKLYVEFAVLQGETEETLRQRIEWVDAALQSPGLGLMIEYDPEPWTLLEGETPWVRMTYVSRSGGK